MQQAGVWAPEVQEKASGQVRETRGTGSPKCDLLTQWT